MNKNELIDVMADQADITKAAAEKALEAFTGAVTTTLKNREKLVLIGFGSFETGERAAREGRNPQTGATIQIPAATVVKFKAGKKLKEEVNQ